MAIVDVKLFATLRKYRPELGVGEAFAVQVPDGATVADLIRLLGLPEDQARIVFVNAVASEQGHVLSDGDQVGIFPPVGGG